MRADVDRAKDLYECPEAGMTRAQVKCVRSVLGPRRQLTLGLRLGPQVAALGPTGPDAVRISVSEVAVARDRL